MLAAWEALRQGIGKVRQDLALVRAVQAVLTAGWLTDDLRESDELVALRDAAVPAQWHPRYYASAIVGTYGAIENFVSELTAESTLLLAKAVQHYSDLPEQLQREHIQQSLRLALLAHERGDDPDLVAAYVTRLHSCVTTGNPFELNAHAMAASTANFRSDVIQKVLWRVGVKLDRSVGADQRCRDALDGILSGVYADAGSVIDDIADRRNDIAHGSEIPELLDLATISAVVDVVEGYLTDLYRLVAQFVVRFSLPLRCQFAGQLHHSWTQPTTGVRSIAGVVVEQGVTITTESRLVVLGSTVRSVSVASIEQENVQQVTVTGDGGVSYGMDLGVQLHAGERLFVMDDSHVDLLHALSPDG